ncbi:MAG: hypothetical protein ACEPOZ_16495 [Marinifilaceae bacterium]
MAESTTISKRAPESRSLQYEFLREEGIKYIQNLAGKIWTDYNAHDPGVTTLEILCYAITELGYRAGYPVKDLLSCAPSDSKSSEAKNFFTAREIFPNSPLTLNDYRKLIMDVDVYDPFNSDCRHVGVKNAWIRKAKSNEIPVYVHQKDSKLEYTPDPLYVPKGDKVEQEPIEMGILYDVLLEFETCDQYGDLNDNSMSGSFVIGEFTSHPNLNGLVISVEVEFPRWDNEEVDWDDLQSVKSEIDRIKVQFFKHPENYNFSCRLENNLVQLAGTITSASDVVNVPGVQEIADRINAFIYTNEDSLLTTYLQKIEKIEEIIEAVKAKLHANRNLCEDFYKLSALKVEKIAICPDIELEQNADVDRVQALIFHEIAKFLSPSVCFYSLEEMLDKSKVRHECSILAIDKTNKSFTLGKDYEPCLQKGDTITISGSRSNDGEYTVKSVRAEKESGRATVFIEEDIFSDLLTEGEILSFYFDEKETGYSVDEIFEGPALEHGFIDSKELDRADRKESIHVSDLIGIIMNIPGVVAVKSIQIANIPQDNDSIPSKCVKWCLDLAFEQNYVPRLSISDSRITFYKDQLPIRASSTKVEELIEGLEAAERMPKLFNPVLDFEVPQGQYRDLEEYQSIQNEFPLTYGIGEEGLSVTGKDEDDLKRRRAQAKQLKGYLMVFDQLLANYFSQLAHLKDLFSMNPEEAGMGRTYFTQSLKEIVKGADELFVNEGGHSRVFNRIVEDEEQYLHRKNKFLDHLLGRFAEKFTDYAMLTFKLSGKLKAPAELIKDKLAFLDAYPVLSSSRGKGLDHQNLSTPWHVDNISGLRRRVSYLAGIDESSADDLVFTNSFAIVASGDTVRIHVCNASSELLLKSDECFKNEEEARLALEKMIVCGICKENYQVLSDGDTSYYFLLECGNEVVGVSRTWDRDSLSNSEIEEVIEKTIEELIGIFSNEFYSNLESNRNNLTCSLENYMDSQIVVELESNPRVAEVRYGLYSEPLSYKSSEKILSGKFVVQGESESDLRKKAEKQTQEIFWQLVDTARKENSYYFTDEGDGYKFRIVNDKGFAIAESVASDFNDALATEISNLKSGKVKISGKQENEGVCYEVDFASADGENVIISLLSTPLTVAANSILSFAESFPFGVDMVNQRFTVEVNLTEILFKGEVIRIQGSNCNDGFYTIASISWCDAYTEIFVEEAIPTDDNSGNLTYTKSFNIQAVSKNSITIKGSYEQKAVSDTIQFVTEKFFSHEGFHVLEHVLLRPKVKGNHFEEIDAERLTEGLSDNGFLYYRTELPVFSASSQSNWFQVEGDISAELDKIPDSHISGEIFISESGANDFRYSVRSVQFNRRTNRTIIKTVEDVPVDIPFSSPKGKLSYYRGVPVSSLSGVRLRLDKRDTKLLDIQPGDTVEIRGSTDGLNDGLYKFAQLTDSATYQEIQLSHMEAEDKLLKIVLKDEECDACQITDPYTCIASVILPHWQGRFDNLDFRRFFQKQLRMETPAHVFLNVCWISFEQMAEFEKKYKAWRIENGKKQKDYGKLSGRLNDLIDTLGRLRNVYPSGTLYDCREKEGFANAIILDNSVLGNA